MKKMLAAALAASMVMGLTACGGSSQPTETKAPESAKETEAAAEGTTEAAAAGDEEKKTGSEMTWKLATDAAKDYPTTKALIKFADEVYEKSNGRIAVDVYESSILGDEVSYMEQLQAGTVDVAKLSIGTLSGLYEDTQVFLLPFLFKNNTEMWKVLEGDVGTTIKNGLNDYSIQGIGFTDCGSRCFYTTTEVKTIDDFKGLPIRVQNNQLMNSMVSNLGANPVNVAANEVYSALQTGVCKGGENNPNIILSDSLYEVAPYVLMDNHTTTMDVICMNLDLWESLSDEDKAIVDEAMADATAYDREIWDASIDESLQTLKDKGATIVEPDEATLDSFREAMAPIYEEYSAKYATLLDAINTTLGK